MEEEEVGPVTNPQPNPLTEEELQRLQEIREVLRTADTPGWMFLLKRMEQHAEDAQEDIIGAIYATNEVLGGLSRRWQQRAAMVRGLKQFVQECKNERDMLLEQNQEHRSVPPDAEQYQEAG